MTISTKLIAVLLFTTLFFSCSVESIEDDTTAQTELATGGEDSATIDDDRDPNGE